MTVDQTLKLHVQKTRRQLRHASEFPAKFDRAIYEAAPRELRKTSKYGVFYQAAKTIPLVLFYYFFSIGLTFYNKWLLKTFHFPLSVTIYHLATKFVIAAIVRSFLLHCTDIKPVTLSWRIYLTRVAPTGLASAFDIGFSNWSMLFITVQLYTMSKSTAVIFILVFGIIFHLQEPHLNQVLTIFLISGGLFMFTYHSTSFNLTGFTLVIVASILSGVRWSLAQLLTQRGGHEGGLRNPVDTIYHLQPVMIIGLLPLAVPVEGLEIASSSHVFGFDESGVFLSFVLIASIGACLAFMLALSEYLLVSQTSSLTLAISGIVKEIFTLCIAINFGSDGDTLSTINILGMVICISGISLHVYMKAREAEKRPVIHRKGEDGMPMLENGEANLSSSEGEDSEEELYSRRKIASMHQSRL
ncbi:Solute carrier family 35 member C2 [Holothuria leucospilota]|uniref:Solute carrier family 35 member C2 n=1 Tax=Holothuria leucospilota TaxID=206669 RepID=A0A9Q1HAG0_HOLLE|nr:Solute carrier family 35 member C2 [Holothuria leucospilota]